MLGALALMAALTAAGTLQAPAASAQRQSPTGWRNDGTGVFVDVSPPLEWDGETGKNVLWKTKTGPDKYSSPIVSGGKVFLAAGPAQLICVDADTGKILWNKKNDFAEANVPDRKVRGDPGNTTPTPVTDGHFVFAVFGSSIVVCYDLNGQRRWLKYLDILPITEYGRAASPVLTCGKLLVSVGCLTALDPETGEQVWKNDEVRELYGTPQPCRIDGVDAVLTPLGQVVRVSDGKILVEDLGVLKYASPLVQGGVAYSMQAGWCAQQVSGLVGDKGAPKLLWEADLQGTFYSSPLFHNGLIFAVSNEGVFSIVGAKEGKILGSKELSIGFAEVAGANLYPSISLAGDYLYVGNDKGDMLVLAWGKEYRELRHNRLAVGHGGTPFFAGRRMYLRDGENLYCIGTR